MIRLALGVALGIVAGCSLPDFDPGLASTCPDASTSCACGIKSSGQYQMGEKFCMYLLCNPCDMAGEDLNAPVDMAEPDAAPSDGGATD